jgi:hypothetical protein
MNIPILSGIFTDDAADFRTSYPVNMVPVPKNTGVSGGYLRPAEGSVRLAGSSGLPRGGINWNDVCYRVMGTKLVSVDALGAETVIGDVGAGGQCSFAYSFDRLAITSGGDLWYWDGVTLDQVLDADLGTALAVVWVDGYFMTTDGEYLVVTELVDPFIVNPLKYGSSEVDPDPILTVLKLRNEICAVNRYTIEFFQNVGGALFPFNRINGAQLQKGAMGTHAACIFAEYIAFIGSGRNEAPGIYFGVLGSTTKLSTREIDTLLLQYTTAELSAVVLESRLYAGHEHLWVRLPDRTLVYDLQASKIMGEQVWYVLTSSQVDFEKYRAVDLIWCYERWLVADSQTGDYGYMDTATARNFGEVCRWEFGTTILYNESRGGIFNSIELVCLTGRVESGEDPYISTSYSTDGITWSIERPIRAGILGDRTRRLAWFQQGHLTNWRIQRFQGDSRALISVARLEAALEPLMS